MPNLQTPKLGDLELLGEYARTGCEAAFATLVERYVNLVYSTARRFSGHPDHAEEITQSVLIILARKAGSLQPGTILPGWLYQTTRLTAANFVKQETRRQHREQEAYMLSTMSDVTSGAWDQIAPLLDEAMGELAEADRNAIVLRFFQNMTVPEVATMMQMNDAAVYKRLTRAVERLRRFYVKRGLALSAVVLGGAITANAVQAAPAGLGAGCITAAQGSPATPAVQSAVRATLQLMAWLRIKFALTMGLSLLGVGGLGTLAFMQLHQKETPVPAAAVAALPKVTGPAALVVAGLMPADAPEDVGTLAAETRRALLARGLAETRVVLLAGQVTRDRILEQLRTVERTGGDEFWLVLLGHSGRTQSGGPAFQVSGARLTAEDLKSALDRIPGRQFVFIGTGSSGSYLSLLQSPRRTVLSATRATGEPDQPRYLSAWVRAFAAAPNAPFATLAGRAAAAVDAFYTQANMGQSEHAQMTDPATGEIMDALKFAASMEKPPRN